MSMIISHIFIQFFVIMTIMILVADEYETDCSIK